MESRQAWFREHTPGDRPIWVVEMDGAVAWWASFESFYGRAAYRAMAKANIDVAPAFRRRGAGRHLLGEDIR